MDESAFTLRRWRERFKTDQRVVAEQLEDGHAPDATSDEVGVPHDNIGFEGRPMRSGPKGNGQGSGDPFSSGWAGWGGG
jgi:hypothetical protein